MFRAFDVLTGFLGCLVGALFLLVSFSFFDKYRKIPSFVKHEGIVIRASISKMGPKSATHIRFTVRYDFQGERYERSPTKFKYPLNRSHLALARLRDDMEGRTVEIRVNKDRPREFVFAADASISAWDWLCSVALPLVFAAICFYTAFFVTLF